MTPKFSLLWKWCDDPRIQPHTMMYDYILPSSTPVSPTPLAVGSSIPGSIFIHCVLHTGMMIYLTKIEHATVVVAAPGLATTSTPMALEMR